MRGFAQRISDSDEAIIFELLMIGRLKKHPPLRQRLQNSTRVLNMQIHVQAITIYAIVRTIHKQC